MVLVLCLAVSDSFALETVDRNGKKYRTGREADPAGFDDWVGQLDGGRARGEIEQRFANSSEFAGIVAEYGLE